MELFTYLLKVSGCMAAFYIVYYTLLRKLTFFSLNRWYLLSALAISLIIPVLHIGVQTLIPAPDVKNIAINTTTQTIADDVAPIVIRHSVKQINWFFIATCAYWVITSTLLLKLIVSLVGIMRKAIKYGKVQGGYRLINGHSTNNSSFFNYIFLNDAGLTNTEKEQVIAHELVHVQLRHSIDNLFTEVLKALLWFNPFVYLYAKALHQVHEFEVDSNLTNRYNSKNYAGLLLKLSAPAQTSMLNQFSAYGLKSRIGMLFAAPSAAAKKLSYLLAVPIIAGLVYFLAVEKVYAYEVSNKNFVVVLDAGHGGKDAGVRGLNGTIEKDLNLQLVKEIKAVADERGVKTILTRNDDKAVTLPNRLVPQGDIFVSVHVNWAPAQNADMSGIKIITSNKNSAPEGSQNLAKAFAKQLEQLPGLNTIDMATQGAYVLSHNQLPAVILELGYLSNKNDVKYLMDKQYRHDMAEKFIDAVIAYQKTGQPKVSGAVSVDDTVRYKSNGVKYQINPVQLTNNTAKKQSKANNSIELPGKSKNGDVIKFTKVTISNTGDQNDKSKSDYSFSDMSSILYSSQDSSRADNVTKTLYLYGKATLTTPKFHIWADNIVLNRRDSLITAKGNIIVKILSKSNGSETTVKTDSLRIDMRWRAKKLVKG